jgi:endoglucanase Acf2
MTTTPATTSADKKYRVTITEQITWEIDVLARDEEQAEEIALEASSKREPDSDGGNFETELLADDSEDFDPVNPA